MIVGPCLLLLAAGPGTAAARADTVDGPRGAGVLVAFPAGTPAEERAAAHARGGGVVRETLEQERVDVVDVASGQLGEALARYRSDAAVRWVEPNREVTLEARANDPLYPGNAAGANDLWGFQNAGQHGGLPDADVDAPEAWDLAALPGDYAVGVIDTGVDADHEDLAGQVVSPCKSALSGDGTLTSGCDDDHGHGTHVSGTIAAAANNGRGVAGLAPGARVLACKALDDDGSGRVADIVACINHLVAVAPTHNLRVISMSLGGPDSPTEAAAVRHAWANGVLVTAAAGNEGTGTVNFPAGYPEAISVAATDRDDQRASFSNANHDVEISAPGVGIVSTVPGGYDSWSGTSMATPHVAAAAAAVARRYGGSAQDVRDRLIRATDDLGASGARRRLRSRAAQPLPCPRRRLHVRAGARPRARRRVLGLGRERRRADLHLRRPALDRLGREDVRLGPRRRREGRRDRLDRARRLSLRGSSPRDADRDRRHGHERVDHPHRDGERQRPATAAAARGPARQVLPPGRPARGDPPALWGGRARHLPPRRGDRPARGPSGARALARPADEPLGAGGDRPRHGAGARRRGRDRRRAPVLLGRAGPPGAPRAPGDRAPHRHGRRGQRRRPPSGRPYCGGAPASSSSP